MKLRLEDITAEAKDLAFAESEVEVNHILEQGTFREYRVEGPLMVSVSYYRAGMELFFAGALKAKMVASCARCAEEFAGAGGRTFRFVLTPRAAGDGQGKDLRVEDLELSLYDGDQVDLSPLIREQLLLALPTRPLCRGDCRGLCPRCGANLNRGACGCAGERAPDPRFSMFRELKIGRHGKIVGKEEPL